MAISRRSVLTSCLAAAVVAGCAGNWDLDGKKILFCGNSYTDFNGGLDAMLTKLAPHTEASRIAPGGSTLQQHAASPDDAKALSSGRWQYVMLQDQSQLPVLQPSDFQAGVSAMVTKARAAHVTPLLLSTWARPDTAAVTTEALDAAYKAVGARLTATVVPAGLAFAASLAARPGLVLNQKDGHPTVAGTYLAACTVYSVLYATSPVGNSAHGGLSTADAEHLQRMAAKVTHR